MGVDGGGISGGGRVWFGNSVMAMWCRREWQGLIPGACVSEMEYSGWGVDDGGSGGGGLWCGRSVIVVWCRGDWLGLIPAAVLKSEKLSIVEGVWRGG